MRGYVAVGEPLIFARRTHPSVAKSPLRNAACSLVFSSRIFFGTRTVYVLHPGVYPASKSICMNSCEQERAP